MVKKALGVGLIIFLSISVFIILFVNTAIPMIGTKKQISTFDNREYLVLSEYKPKEELEKSFKLAVIRNKLNNLLTELRQDKNYLETNFGTHANGIISRLNFEPEDIQESTSSYTINKKTMNLCLRTINNEFSSINTITFVAIHELGHIISAQADPGHQTQEFHSNFENLLRFAYKQGIWDYIDYSISPVFYCGINVDSTPDIL
jgi:hypothetical protein